MITVKVPLRISFVGGGTDYPEYLMGSQSIGRVLGCTINEYVYISALRQPLFEEVKYRFTYRITESVQDIRDFSHPVLRAALLDRKWNTPLNVSTMATLPGRSGLGSSSSFTVGLTVLLDEIQGKRRTKMEIAKKAIEIERKILGEPGGFQDQLHATFGGFRLYTMEQDAIEIEEPIGDPEVVSTISKSLFLVAVGTPRDSRIFAKDTGDKVSLPSNKAELNDLSELTLDTYNKMKNAVTSNCLEIIAEAINEGWKIKSRLSKDGSTKASEVISRGLEAGALGGKLCGAGGSGFAAFIVPEKKQARFLSAFAFENVMSPKIVQGGVGIAKF